MTNIKIFGKNSEPIPISGSSYGELKKYIDYKIDKVVKDFRKELEVKTGKSTLTTRQKSIKESVDNRKVRYEVIKS